MSAGRLTSAWEFVEGALQSLLKQDGCAPSPVRVTWLELMVMFVIEGSVAFPVASASGSGWVPS